MANKEISALTTVSLPLTGAEVFHAKQGANSREVNFAELGEYIGRGPSVVGLGRAKFSAPGNVFTAYNSAAPVTNAFQGATGHWLIEHATDDGLSCAVEAVSAGDFDKVFVMSAHGFEDTVASADIQMGLIVSDGVDSVSVAAVDTGLTFQKNFRGTNRLTFVSTNATKSVLGRGALPLDTLVWWRVTRVTSTVTYYISHNGFDWHTIATGTDTENSMSSILEVGVFMGTASATQAETCFLRVVGYDNGPQAEARSGGGTLPVPFKGFRAFDAATAQAISAATETVILMDSVSFDTEAAHDGVNGYIVPASLDGKYMVFEGQIGFDAAEIGTAFIYQGATIIGAMNIDATTRVQVSSGPVLVTTGEEIQLRVFTADGANAEATVASTWFSGYVIESSEDAIEYVTSAATTYTLTATDFNGRRILEFTSGSAIALTLNTGVIPGGPLTVIQGGAGQITVSGTGTVEAKLSSLKSNGEESSFTLVPTNTANTYKMIGDITG
jgi:hypothetical protein